MNSDLPRSADSAINRIGAIAVQVAGPALTILTVSSIAWFLVEVSYSGPLVDRCKWIFALFCFAAVLISRISIEEGFERASGYGFLLAVATLLVTSRFMQGNVIGLALILAFVWWCAGRLTWDCTFIDKSRDATGQGMIDLAIDRVTGNRDRSERDAPVIPPASADPRIQSSPETVWQKFKRIFFRRRQANTPGLWAFYFLIGGLPLFGLGQLLMPINDAAGHRAVAGHFFVYITSLLGLLMLSSITGLHRYLARNNADVPERVARRWIVSGTILAISIAAMAWLLPRPTPGFSLAGLIPRLTSQNLAPSRNSAGRDGQKAADQNNNAGAGPRDRDTGNNESNPDAGRGGNQKSGNQGPVADQPGSSNAGGKASGKSSGGGPKSKSGEKSSGQNEPSGKSSGGGQKSSGEKSSGEKSSGEKSSGEKSSGEKSSGEKSSGEKSSGEKSSGEKSSGEKSSGEKSSGEKSSGEKSSGEPTSGQQPETDSQSSGKSGEPDSPPTDRSQANDQQDPASRRSSASNPPRLEPDRPENNARQNGSAQRRPRDNSARPSSDPSAADQQRQSGSGWLSRLGRFLQFLAWCVAVLVVAWFVIRYRAQILPWIKSFLAEMAEFWNRLFQRKRRNTGRAAALVTAESRQTHLPAFTGFQNPFTTGRAELWSPEQIVLYTFQAFEAWSRDHQCHREPDQTALEFARQTSRSYQSLKTDALNLATLYSQLAYARSGVTRTAAMTLASLWDKLSAMYSSPAATAGAGTASTGEGRG